MDWFLYDNDLRLERVKREHYSADCDVYHNVLINRALMCRTVADSELLKT